MEIKNICENCNCVHDGTYGSSRFCGVVCSRSFSTKNKRGEINLKVSSKLKNKGRNGVNLLCKECGNKYYRSLSKSKNSKFCSNSCKIIWLNKNKNIGRLGGLASVKAQSEFRRSKNEIYFSELCKKYFKEVLTNEPIFNGWDADVILTNEKIAILWNGSWHYKKITRSHSVAQVQNRDYIKIREIKKVGYYPYIIKDMGKFSKQFVEYQFELFLLRLPLQNK